MKRNIQIDGENQVKYPKITLFQLDDLPDEIIGEIFSFLSSTEHIQRVRLINHRYNCISCPYVSEFIVSENAPTSTHNTDQTFTIFSIIRIFPKLATFDWTYNKDLCKIEKMIGKGGFELMKREWDDEIVKLCKYLPKIVIMGRYGTFKHGIWQSYPD